MVTLVATGESAQQAAEFLDKEMDSIIQKHKLLFDDGVVSIKKSKNQAETQQRENITQLKYLDEQVAQSDSLEVRSTLIQEKAILIRQNGELSEKILATEQMLSELQTYPTEIVRSASLPLKPIRPKPLLYVAIAAFVGLFIGLGLIMLTEFSRHVRAASSK
jgi:LPS O-antigen subunit length determinant protein (WzzB/FepE family)